MKTEFRSTIVALLALSIIGGFVVFGNKSHAKNNTVQNNPVPVVKTGYISAAPAPPDFEKAAENSVASVVQIKTITRFKQTSRQRQQNPMGDMFGGDDFFQRFFGNGSGSLPQPDQRASGSGVIISNDGYIVTNNHVVDGANEVSVTLNNRREYNAKVVGIDPNTDLALLKIDAQNLPAMPVGNSDNVHLGQWVLAIGYPLNLDVTVTQGIISAKSRSIGINRQGPAPVEAFLQTDAAVNPGSSGGALINTDGELIGINSAIASPTGSYAGYAYAVPSNLLKKVVGDIRQFGSVQRGYLGISMAPNDLDDAKKKELGIPVNTVGVYVIETDPAGAAAAAGIVKGDAIVKIDGQAIESGSQLAEQVARHKPGDKITLSFMRGNQEKTVTAILKNKAGSFASQQNAAIESLGASFAELNKTEAQNAGISGGVQVTAINEGIISDQTNMKPGFIITKVGGITVKTVNDLKQAITKQNTNFQLEGVYPGSNEVYYYGINGFRQ